MMAGYVLKETQFVDWSHHGEDHMYMILNQLSPSFEWDGPSFLLSHLVWYLYTVVVIWKREISLFF